MVDVKAETDKLAEKVELAIGGKLYAGWQSVSITRSLESLSGSFSLSLAYKATTADAELEINAGDKCRVLVGGEPVIDGWVDAVERSISGDDHAITVTGRDRTADLADCSAVHKPGSWSNVKLETIASELAKPFGVSVTAKASTGKPIAKFALQQGETVQAAIERLLRFRGLLMTPTADGNLQIITPDSGAPAATLEHGVNILSGSSKLDDSQRFSDYLIKGQAKGDNHKHGKTVSQIKGDATDPGVTRHRPMLIVAEEQGDGASLAVRAKWEAGVRAGKAVSAEISVLGWRVSAGGKLWAPNLPVRVKSAPLKLADRQMIVTAVSFTKSDSGTTAALTLMPPGAWAQLAAPEGKK
ncbi:MAG: phage baseplate assembly protein [Sphingomonas sp.]